MPKITIYSNGILVNSRFYDFSDPSSLELKTMLERGEFDREALDLRGKTAEVMVVSRNDYYAGSVTGDSKRSISSAIDNVKKLRIDGVHSPMPARFKYIVGRGKVPMDASSSHKDTKAKNTEESQGMLCLPQEVHLGMPGTVKFKLVYENRTTTILAGERVTVGDLVSYIRERTGKTVTLSKRGELLDDNELVQALKNCMLDMIL